MRGTCIIDLQVHACLQRQMEGIRLIKHEPALQLLVFFHATRIQIIMAAPMIAQPRSMLWDFSLHACSRRFPCLRRSMGAWGWLQDTSNWSPPHHRQQVRRIPSLRVQAHSTSPEHRKQGCRPTQACGISHDIAIFQPCWSLHYR